MIKNVGIQCFQYDSCSAAPPSEWKLQPLQLLLTTGLKFLCKCTCIVLQVNKVCSSSYTFCILACFIMKLSSCLVSCISTKPEEQADTSRANNPSTSSHHYSHWSSSSTQKEKREEVLSLTGKAPKVPPLGKDPLSEDIPVGFLWETSCPYWSQQKEKVHPVCLLPNLD